MTDLTGRFKYKYSKGNKMADSIAQRVKSRVSSVPDNNPAVDLDWLIDEMEIEFLMEKARENKIKVSSKTLQGIKGIIYHTVYTPLGQITYKQQTNSNMCKRYSIFA
jgi:hypothetical protein